jgi:hypothetical protein
LLLSRGFLHESSFLGTCVPICRARGRRRPRSTGGTEARDGATSSHRATHVETVPLPHSANRMDRIDSAAPGEEKSSIGTRRSRSGEEATSRLRASDLAEELREILRNLPSISPGHRG